MIKPKRLPSLFTCICSPLKLDVAYFAKGGFFTTLQQIIGVTSGLTVSYLFGHFISKELFGEYNLVLSIISMITFLSLPGIDTALTRSVGQGYDTSLLKSTRLKMYFAFLAIPVLLGFSIFYFLIKQNTGIAIALAIASFFYPLLNTFTLYRSFLVAKHKFGLLALLSSFSSLSFLAAITVAIFFSPTTYGLILGYLVGIVFPSFVSFLLVQRFVKKSKKKDVGLSSYGAFLTVISILPWISGNLGNVLLGNMLGVEALAVFSVASRFLTAVQKNFAVFYKPATAKLATQSPKEHIETLKHHSWKFILLGIGLCVTLWIATPFLISFFFTKNYHEAISYGRLLSFALIPLPLTFAITDIIIYQKQKQPQIVMSTIPQIIRIILYFILIPLWKINGLVAIIIIDRIIGLLFPLFFVWQSAKKIKSNKHLQN